MTVLRHPAALTLAARQLGDASSDLKAALESLRATMKESALDEEFKAKMTTGLDEWIAQLDRLIPQFGSKPHGAR